MSKPQGQWAKTIQPKSDQLNADDLVGGDKLIRIRDIKISEGDQPASMFYDGDDGKPYKPNKTMRKIIAHCWGLVESEYIGRYILLYRDESVKWGGEEVGGIRIKAMSHIDDRKRISLQISRGKKLPFIIEPLRVPDAQVHASDRPAPTAPVADPATQAKNYAGSLKKQFSDAKTEQELEAVWEKSRKVIGRLQDGYPSLYEGVNDAYLVRKDALSNPPIDADSDFDVFGLPEIEPNHAAGN